MINNKITLTITTILYLISVFTYTSHVPIDYISHDFWQHVDYTEFIIKNHRIPKPYEGWEAFQPPLYYLINSFIAPKAFITDKMQHVKLVVALSVIYGGITLFLISKALEIVNKDPISRLLVLSLLATTPRFIFIFTTYNNDTLGLMLSVAVLTISLKLYNNWSKSFSIYLLISATAGLYTKITVSIPILSILLLCFISNFIKKSSSKTSNQIALILLLSFLIYSPWPIFHTYKHTGKLMVTNQPAIVPKFDIDSFIKFLNIVSPTAIFQNQPHKWDTPFSHWAGGPSTKKFDYWTYQFLHSINQGCEFQKPSQTVIWIMIWCHLIIYICGILQFLRNNITKFVAFTIFIAHLSNIFNFLYTYALRPFDEYPNANPFMEFRYIAWQWAPWMVLYSTALTNKKSVIYFLLSRTILISIFMHIYFLSKVSF